MFRILLTMAFVGLASLSAAETRIPQSQAEISLGFAPLVKQAAPAVVNIYAKRVVQARQTPFQGDPFFEDFFRGFGTPQPRVQNSLGSGVILSADGIVVSNYHVVGMATDIRVVLTDRREYSARVLLSDKESDLAILQLEQAENLPFLSLRDSDRVQVGELALAIGNPFGVGQTVSSGIISGLARSGAATGSARGYFIQTDAPINPGNSGGALVDMNGALIGINTRILSRSGGSNGIGFAIPANLVAQFVTQAQDGQVVFQRPWAGMAGQAVDADLAAGLGLRVPGGVLVSDLHPESPFAQQRIRVGDVITSVNGEPVNTPSEMLFRMTVAGIGGTASISAFRDGETMDVDVDMMIAPDSPPSEELQLDQDAILAGLTVARANPAVISRLGLPLNTEGVVVLNPQAIGARVGLRPGDILVSINDERIGRPSDVRDSLSRASRRVRIDLERQGRPISLRFRL